MADDSDKQNAPKLPPKLNLRKQGVLKQEPATKAEPPAKPAPTVEPQTETPSEPTLAPKPAHETAVKQDTARLVVKPAASKPAPETAPAQKAEPETVLAAAAATPAIKLKPLKPKPAPAAKAPEPAKPETEAQSEPSAEKTEAPAKSDTKRKTSRIPLEKAQAPVDAAPAEGAAMLKPKTIKIKPSVPFPQVRSTQPLSVTVPIAEPDTDKIRADATKRQTSRIPLEDALTADKESDEPAEPVDPARPKTIKIKRPGSEATTAKAKKPAAPKIDDNEMSKTARLDHLPLDDAASTPTQKKTIRVKRPDSASTTTSSPDAPAAPRSGGLGLTPPAPLEQTRTEELGAVWAILALAATVILCVVIYMLAAQAVGPNVTGTALSSWTDGPNLSWPGKL